MVPREPYMLVSAWSSAGRFHMPTRGIKMFNAQTAHYLGRWLAGDAKIAVEALKLVLTTFGQ